MGDVYVECGSMTYDEKKAPKGYAADVKKKMGAVVQRVIGSTKGYTTKKPSGNPEGYSLNLRVSEIAVDGKTTSCKITGELLTYPKHAMVSASMSGNGKASGDDAAAALDCIDAVAEDLVKKSVKYMK